jgi:8-oxo-dGTP diphosphatase
MQLRTGANAAEVAWFEVDAASRKRLAFDHGELLDAAVARLRSKVEYTSLPAFLLEEPFTLPALQHTYEVVLGRGIDKSAFRKRMLDGEFMEEAGMVTGSLGRPAMSYRLRDRSQAALFPRTFNAR